jgi:hypothetical protein
MKKIWLEMDPQGTGVFLHFTEPYPDGDEDGLFWKSSTNCVSLDIDQKFRPDTVAEFELKEIWERK